MTQLCPELRLLLPAKSIADDVHQTAGTLARSGHRGRPPRRSSPRAGSLRSLMDPRRLLFARCRARSTARRAAACIAWPLLWGRRAFARSRTPAKSPRSSRTCASDNARRRRCTSRSVCSSRGSGTADRRATTSAHRDTGVRSCAAATASRDRCCACPAMRWSARGPDRGCRGGTTCADRAPPRTARRGRALPRRSARYIALHAFMYSSSTFDRRSQLVSAVARPLVVNAR